MREMITKVAMERFTGIFSGTSHPCIRPDVWRKLGVGCDVVIQDVISKFFCCFFCVCLGYENFSKAVFNFIYLKGWHCEKHFEPEASLRILVFVISCEAIFLDLPVPGLCKMEAASFDLSILKTALIAT